MEENYMLYIPITQMSISGEPTNLSRQGSKANGTLKNPLNKRGCRDWELTD